MALSLGFCIKPIIQSDVNKQDQYLMVQILNPLLLKYPKACSQTFVLVHCHVYDLPIACRLAERIGSSFSFTRLVIA